MKKLQQIILIIVAFCCLYIAYQRYFISHYGWKSPATLVAFSLLLVLQVWELERPEKELTTPELMENMAQEAVPKHKIYLYAEFIMPILSWGGILAFAIWLRYPMLIIGVIICILLLVFKMVFENYEKNKKDKEIMDLIQQINKSEDRQTSSTKENK